MNNLTMFNLKLFKKYVKSPPLIKKKNLRLWQHVLILAQAKGIFSTNTTNILKPNFNKIKILRIEEFKTNSSKFFKSKNIISTFISSGTTTEQRSHSHFSHDGLILYKLSAIYTFYCMLISTGIPNVLSYHPISLIQPELQNSSLSQMLKWLSEFWNIKFINEQDLPDYIKSLNNKPCWIFATALQYLNIINNNQKLKLHKSSLIIETGGTKGQYTTITKLHLYDKISKLFDISLNNIISEYSMCELASQAYDVVKPISKKITIQKRYFKFPIWVTLFITQGLNTILEKGKGSLMIYDPLRIDYPFIITTQDICCLSKNQHFKILTRVPYSVLKGCSITYEKPRNIITEKIVHKLQTHINKSDKIQWQLNIKQIHQKYNHIQQIFPQFISDKNNIKSLAKIIGSYKVAKNDLINLMSCFDFKNFDTILHALIKATNANTNLYTYAPTKWIFILPSSHPIAGFYPIIFAYLLGLHVKIRLHDFNLQNDQNILINFIKLLPKHHFSFLNQSFKIGISTIPSDTQAILIFGSDNTIEYIKSITDIPVQGFGSHIAGSFITFTELYSNLTLIIKDAFSLKQLGCMSSRFLFIFHNKNQTINLKNLTQMLTKYSYKFWGTSLSIEDSIALDNEEYICIQNKIKLYKRKTVNDFLFPFYTYPKIENILSTRPLVLPIITCQINSTTDYTQYLEYLRIKIPDLKLALLSNQLLNNNTLTSYLRKHHIIYRTQGNAQIPILDGFHNNKPLFICK